MTLIRLFILCFFSIILTACGGGTNLTDDIEINPATLSLLKKCDTHLIHQEPLTSNDVSSTTRLDCAFGSLENSLTLSEAELKELKKFTHLQSLSFANFNYDDKNLIFNVFPDLSSLQKLTSLTISGVDFINDTNISALQNLEELTIGNIATGEEIGVDFDISQLSKLQAISLSEIKPNDSFRIVNLEQLKSLHLSNFSLNDSFEITDVNSLKELTIDDLRQNNSFTIPDSPKLEIIRVTSTKLPSKLDLSSYINLKNLKLNYNQIKTIKGISNLNKIIELNFQGNEIESLPALPRENLTSLDISNNKFTELPDLSHLTNLEELSIGGNSFTELQDLSNLVQLKILKIYENGTETLTLPDLSALKNLTELLLRFTSLNSFPDISNNEKLTSALFFYDRTMDISPLLSPSSEVAPAKITIEIDCLDDIKTRYATPKWLSFYYDDIHPGREACR